ncbi:PadR family transcriptional regulator [Marinitenerispora sediminis]|uniref:PadR family transcriptional regulator n=1 Tax=Marinitenerispora sediminis TaxID=1931232 RepID=A0A368T881_9ACTN|nr:PadR family transcriptional regulator [Marinitenerispora sediminis]RCV51121.1 PadR family transcriptional regulator [Marinitenerispora sediminis]RCV58336.1 PadR family transcriptional regulator [Marinitenerispora sediminis]RCV60140.1 PadR family transcriptional regulator [Marinitenerispora sediminis]
MSTIFGHGRLRLYLLKLLDESPRHGYEIISLLRDRFLGVYSPSPGTIYPRLARLEEEGLVTHEEVNGRKVYRLTDKGREELRDRSAELDDLEREITDSVRDVARAVKQDVRDTISSLREELKFAAGDFRRTRTARERGAGSAPPESDDVWRQASSEPAGEPAGGGDEAAGGSGSEEERARGGTWWDRDWEKLAHGFSTWGAAWSRRSGEGAGGRPDFEHTLREFTDRVRDVVREAGHVGESAAADLRRILDDTVEVIRRDASSWGPPGTGRDAREETGASAGRGPEEGSADAGGRPAADTASPPPDAGDPWSSAVRETPDGPRDPGGASGTGPAGDERPDGPSPSS